MSIREYIGVELETLARLLRNFCINVLPDLWIVNRYLRPAVAQLFGASCGSGVILQKGIFYGNVRNLKIGQRSVICRGAFLDGCGRIDIGENVGIAFQVTFITSSHEIGAAQKRVGSLTRANIQIGNGCWIGARAIIGPGVIMAAGSVLSAGSSLMRACPPNSLVAGIPGRIVTTLAKEPCCDSLACRP